MAERNATERKRGPGKPFPKGVSGNPGGMRKSIREVEQMLDAEHRNVEKMRETFALLRKVAHGVDEPVFYKGVQCATKRVYDSGFMELYLNRVLGPVKELKVDMSDWPDEMVAFFADKVAN